METYGKPTVKERLKKGYRRAREIAANLKQKQEQKAFRKKLERDEQMRIRQAEAKEKAEYAKTETKRMQAQAKAYRAAQSLKEAKAKYREQLASKSVPFLRPPSQLSIDMSPQSFFGSKQPAKKAKKGKKQKGIRGLDYL